MILGVDVGGTFTDAALLTGDRLVTGKSPTHARRPVRGRAWPPSTRRSTAAGARRRRRGALRARDDRRHERAARGHAWRAPRCSPPRASPTSRSSAARRAPSCTGSARATRRRSCRPSCACRCPSAPAPTACCGRSTRTRCASARRALDVRGGRGLPAVGLPPPASTSSASAELLERGAAGRPRVDLARDRRRVPRVRALRDHDRRRRALAAAARLPRAAHRARPRRRPARARGDALERRHGRAPRTAARHGSWTVLSGPAGGAVGAARDAAGGGRAPTRSWPRHGRHLLRRVADRWTAPPRWAAGARSAAGRWRCRWWTCTRSAPAAARSPGATRAARCAWGRARRAPTPARPATGAAASEPTVTDANLLLGYLDADSPLAGGVRLDRGRGGAGGGRAGRRARARARGDRRRHRPRGERRDGPGRARGDGASAASTRASSRSCRSAAPARCTPPQIAERAGHAPRARAAWRAGVLSALGLVVSERRRDLVESVLLDAATSSRREAIAAVVERLARARAGGAARAGDPGGRAARHLRPALRGPGLRADGRTATRAPDPQRAARRLRPRPRGALRLRGPGGRARARDACAWRWRCRGAEPPPAAPSGDGADPRRRCFDGERVDAAVVRGAPRARRARDRRAARGDAGGAARLARAADDGAVVMER